MPGTGWSPLPQVFKRSVPKRTPDRSKPLTSGKFVVSGSRTVHGAAPGEVVELNLPTEHIDRLIASGHLVPHIERAMPTPDEEEV